MGDNSRINSLRWWSSKTRLQTPGCSRLGSGVGFSPGGSEVCPWGHREGQRTGARSAGRRLWVGVRPPGFGSPHVLLGGRETIIKDK